MMCHDAGYGDNVFEVLTMSIFCLRHFIGSMAIMMFANLYATGAAMAADSAPTKPNVAPAGPGSATPLSAELSSYDVGLLLGSQLEHNGLAPKLVVDELVRGIKDSLGTHIITADERDAALQFMRGARNSIAEKNRGEGREFLARNAQQPGVVALPSGLQYRIVTPADATGPSPTSTDQVTVRYTAAFADGTVFDRSDTHDRPASFRVNSVFKGWQEAFLKMKPGAKWQLFIPPELGYGNNPPPSIPPGAVLVYEIELLRIDAAPVIDPSLSGHAGKPTAAAPTH
jgi:FKBP-type peptidyl-prolyl cis-trans isomerase FklB